MDWLKKLLEAANLSPEQIASITKGVEDNYKDHVPKQQLEDMTNVKTQLEAQLKDRDKQLKSLKDTAGSNDDLKKEIEKLEAENKQKDTDYQNQIRDLNMQTAVVKMVAGKVHDPELLFSILDKSKIELNEDGSIKAGLDDQLKGLREGKPFLFVPDDGNKPRFKGVILPDGSGGNRSDTEGSIGASFAKAANDSGKAPAAGMNPWG